MNSTIVFGAGDVFESKEFVRAIIKLLKPEKSFYFHGKSKRILLDMPEVEQVHLTDPNRHHSMKFIQRIGNSVLINTWIGRDSRYVLPGIGCTVEMLLQMYRDANLNLPGNPEDYIPRIDYSYYIKSDYLKDLKFFPAKVFFSNGPVQSCQAENFDFTPVILRLAEEYKKEGVLFLTTHGVPERFNVMDMNWLFPEVNFNLNELSYLSTFCDLIIGRNSGPQVFTWTKENCDNPNITNLTFSYNINCAHFVHHSPMKMKKYWSPETSEKRVFEVIKETLDEVIERKKN